ncbi:hypothetical protein F5Y19DRAFT_424705 [Xylariaceae sp. FL1651]|nr:hypothetical protein F5Y19DRAFT_424705 [Xylariaceae sp. FL1651]
MPVQPSKSTKLRVINKTSKPPMAQEGAEVSEMLRRWLADSGPHGDHWTPERSGPRQESSANTSMKTTR